MRKVGPVGVNNEKTYAAESIITSNYAVAKGVTDGDCTAVTVAGQRCLGIASIAQNYVGGPVPVIRFGDALAIAAGAITYGDYVKTDAAGRMVTSTAAGDEVIGRAESSAVNPGDQLIVFVNPQIR